MKNLNGFFWALVCVAFTSTVFAAQWVDDGLCEAAAKNNVKKVIKLISNNADVNAKNPEGQTPLTIAANKGYVEIAKLLIEKGADINMRSSGGDTPLISAMSGDYSEIECLALATPLMSAHLAAATVPLTGREGSLDDKNNDERTSLIEAECHDPAQIVKFLIDNGADINARGQNGRTPLMVAAINGYAEITKLLLAKGADAGMISDKGETALSLAKANNNTAIVVLLTQAGADRPA